MTPHFQELQDDDRASVDTVLREARSASVTLAALSRQDRAEVLTALAAGLERDSETLVSIAAAETHLDAAVLGAEVDRTVAQLRFFGEVLLDGAYLEVAIDTDRGAETVHRMLVPLGVAAVFGSSNFPFAYGVAGGDSASALAAGCAIVVKEHPSHPLTCRAVLDNLRATLQRLGLPASIASLVRGFAAGQQLVQSPEVRAVGFTGSTGGGRALFDLAVRRPDPIPFYGELGSLNCVMVTAGAARRRGIEIGTLVAESLLRRGGQMCTKPGLVLLPSGEDGDAVLEALGSCVGSAPAVELLNDGVRGHFTRGTIEMADMEGVEIVAGALTVRANGAVSPVLFSAAVRNISEVAGLDEVFGPVALVLRYDSVAEVVGVLGRLNAALVAGIHAEPDERQLLELVVPGLAAVAGRLVWGGATTGLSVGWATHHGGGYPASTSVLHTSVGAHAIRRWLRPISYQGFPENVIPRELQVDRPDRPMSRIDGVVVPRR